MKPLKLTRSGAKQAGRSSKKNVMLVKARKKHHSALSPNFLAKDASCKFLDALFDRFVQQLMVVAFAQPPQCNLQVQSCKSSKELHITEHSFAQPLQCDLQTHFITNLQDVKELRVWLQQPLQCKHCTTMKNSEGAAESSNIAATSAPPHQHAAPHRISSQKWLERVSNAQQPTGSDTTERHKKSQNTMAQSARSL